MRHLTPRYILEELAAGRRAGGLDATCLFVDISGFTPLTLALMEHGAEGAEVLADVLARVFDPLIEAVYARGGFVATFAGDAFTAIFPTARADGTQLAVTAAWEIHRRLVDAADVATRFGHFRFSGKVCVAAGPVTWRVWEADSSVAGALNQQAACVIDGDGLRAATQLDPVARRGDVVLSDAVLAQLPTQAIRVAPGDGWGRLEDYTGSVAAAVPTGGDDASRSSALIAEARRFFPHHLLETALQGEFRRVTTAFVNLAHGLAGDEMTAFASNLFNALDQYGGYLSRVGRIGGKDDGNTLLLFWGAPAGSERDVERALGFLLALQRHCPVPLRAGVTTHLAYAGFVGSARREEYTCYGSYVNLAARQLVSADFGEIWLDEATARQAHGFALTEHGRHMFKGFDAPQPIFLLTGQSERERDQFYRSRLHGRDQELERMAAAFEPLRNGRFGGVLAIVGEAGMGKSRLAHEFLQQVTADLNPQSPFSDPKSPRPNPQSFLCQTDEILRQPLNPFRYWLRRYFNQSAKQSEAENKRAFEAKLAWLLDELETRHQKLETAPESGAFGSSVGARTPPLHSATRTPQSEIRTPQSEILRLRSFLGALIDLRWEGSLYEQLEPQLRYENTLEALRALIGAESLRRPVALHLEDAHWLDAESAEFLDKLLRHAVELPILLLATVRPREGHDGDIDLASNLPDGTPFTRIDLAALDQTGVVAMAEELLGDTLHPQLTQELIDRVDGNPFFAEQILLYLREQKLLRVGDSGWELIEDRFTAHSVLSGDIRAVLTARLDRLSATVKEVVQTAAVLGREFDVAVLMKMLDDGRSLLPDLQAADRAAVWSAIDQTSYLFRHALLRDAAYDMQLRARLRALHGRAAGALQKVFGHELGPYYADLVYHYGRAEDRSGERRFASLAGEYAAERFANEDALRYLQRAIELTVDRPAVERFNLLLKLEEVHNTVGDRQAQAADLAQLQKITTDSADPAHRASLYLRRANLARTTADYAKAISHVEMAYDQALLAKRADLEIEALNLWGRIHWRLHQPAAAARRLDEALRKAQAQHNASAIARNRYDLGLVAYNQAQYEEAFGHFQTAGEAFASLADIKGEALCQGMIGTVQTRQGDYGNAIDNLRTGLELVSSIGWVPGQTYFLANLGDALLAVGALEDALRYHQEAHQLCSQIGDREGEAYSLDVLGLIAYFQQDHAHALEYINAALSIYAAIGNRRLQTYAYNHLAHAAYRAGDLVVAQQAVAQAESLTAEDANAALSIDTRSARAGVAWAKGSLQEALRQSDAIADYIRTHGLDGLEYPVQVCELCYAINCAAIEFEPTRQATAMRFLDYAHKHLQKRAAALPADLRASYLQNIPAHRAVLALCEAEITEQ